MGIGVIFSLQKCVPPGKAGYGGSGMTGASPPSGAIPANNLPGFSVRPQSDVLRRDQPHRFAPISGSAGSDFLLKRFFT